VVQLSQAYRAVGSGGVGKVVRTEYEGHACGGNDTAKETLENNVTNRINN